MAKDLGSREFFLEVYSELKAYIVDEVIPAYGLPPEAATWNADMIEYNVPGAWRGRGYAGAAEAA